MPFNLRNRQAILRDMVAQFMAITPLITDFTDGAVARALLETVATQIGKEDHAIYDGFKEAIDTAVYKAFSFSQLPPSFTNGIERFFGAPLTPQDIPLGTRVGVPGTNLIYTTTADATMLAGGPYVDVPVIASVVGTAGNTIADTIIQLIDPLAFVTSVANILPLNNGTDQETASQRFQRFQDFIAGLSRGTAYSIRAAARGVFIADANGNATERVAYALVYEPWKFGGPIGNVSVYIDNGSGTASPALVALVTNVEEGYVQPGGGLVAGYIGAGVKPLVAAVVSAPISIVGEVEIDPNAPNSAAVLTAVNQAIGNYLSTLQVGDTMIAQQLVRYALDVPWTVDVEFTSPIADVIPVIGQRIVPGVLNITQMASV